MTLETRWEIAAPPPPEVQHALRRFPPLWQRLLYARGIRDYAAAKAFLEAHAPPYAHDPFALRDMEAAVDRIAYAIRQGEPIVVYGDYDVDGVTANALLTQTLQALGAQVQPYIPNRFEEGYGLNAEALTRLHAAGARLVVTVDCGIRPAEPVEHARRLGLDIVVTDHHHPPANLPPARAVVNPRRADDPYPDKHLAGVGVAFKLAQALVQRLAPKQARSVQQHLDLVALGTVADVVPLRGENRHWVRAGLRLLRQPRRQGLYSLMGVAGVKPERLNAGHIGFILGPRLNAAGRLDSAMAALRLLLTNNVWEAGRLAQQLDVQNRRRQQLTEQTVRQAQALAIADPENPPWVLFAAHPDFNPGVVGLAAARLVEQFHRPALVAQIEGERVRGSARSIPQVHITRALEACAALLERYGGHAAAAGFTLALAHLDAFRECLTAAVREQMQGQDLRPVLRADAEVTLADLNTELLHNLRWFEPTGMGNPRPRFVVRNVRIHQIRVMGAQGQHVRFMADDGTARRPVVAFRLAQRVRQAPPRLDLLVTLEWNHYNGGAPALQLQVKDLRPSEGG